MFGPLQLAPLDPEEHIHGDAVPIHLSGCCQTKPLAKVCPYCQVQVFGCSFCHFIFFASLHWIMIHEMSMEIK